VNIVDNYDPAIDRRTLTEYVTSARPNGEALLPVAITEAVVLPKELTLTGAVVLSASSCREISSVRRSSEIEGQMS
jgi:hypothetical protein